MFQTLVSKSRSFQRHHIVQHFPIPYPFSTIQKALKSLSWWEISALYIYITYYELIYQHVYTVHVPLIPDKFSKLRSTLSMTIHTSKNMNITALWEVTQLTLISRHQHFGATCCLHLQCSAFQPTRHCIPDDSRHSTSYRHWEHQISYIRELQLQKQWLLPWQSDIADTFKNRHQF
jgi:hypothetical protein